MSFVDEIEDIPEVTPFEIWAESEGDNFIGEDFFCCFYFDGGTERWEVEDARLVVVGRDGGEFEVNAEFPGESIGFNKADAALQEDVMFLGLTRGTGDEWIGILEKTGDVGC